MQYTAQTPQGTIDIPAALSASDAKRIACEATGAMPWQVRVTKVESAT